MTRLTSVLYRSLLRHARMLDRHPEMKATLSPVVSGDAGGWNDSALMVNVWRHVLRGGSFYQPTVCMESLVRRLFRRKMDNFSQQDRLDCGFEVLRYLRANFAVHSHIKDIQSRKPRKTSVSLLPCEDMSLCKGAADTSRSGSLLISHPLLLESTFRRTVVLMLPSDAGYRGLRGVILNSPTRFRVADLVRPPKLHVHQQLSAEAKRSFELRRMLCEAPFGDSVVFRGGPVGGSELLWLHRQRLDGAFKVADGVYVGGDLEQAMESIATGDMHPSEFTFFSGFAAWGDSLLAHELEEHSWYALRGAGVGEFVFPTGAEPQHGVYQWQRALTSLGGEYTSFADHLSALSEEDVLPPAVASQSDDSLHEVVAGPGAG